jgi:hypothetical protein
MVRSLTESHTEADPMIYGIQSVMIVVFTEVCST